MFVQTRTVERQRGRHRHIYVWGEEMKAYQVNRQEGGLVSDIKGGVEFRPQPSGNHTGDQERLTNIRRGSS